MRRMVLLGTLLIVGAAGIAAGQREQRSQTAELEKVRENLYVIRGGGGNTAAFVTQSGVVLVDTKLAGWGERIMEQVRKVTDKPVTTIINTHTHGDHVSGNVEFPATVEVVTHENTAANMKKMAAVTGFKAPATPMPNIFTTHEGRGLPQRTFNDRLTVGKGASRVDLYYFGRGHTNGDAFVVFPSLGVMHAGHVPG